MKTNAVRMKTILYATDCSEHDSAIIQYTSELSDILKARLVPLHVFKIPILSFNQAQL